MTKHFAAFLASIGAPRFIAFVSPLTASDKIGPKKRIDNPNCTIFDGWNFDSFLLADESFVKAVQRFETVASVNNDLCGKLVSSLESRIWWKI